MYRELREILYDAEEHYLQGGEIDKLRGNVEALKQRLEIYKILRDRELDIFQAIANQLEGELNPLEIQLVPEAIIHWATVQRYLAMAVLLHSSEFLHRRILEWLTPVIQAHSRIALDNRIYGLLCSRLKEILNEKQWEIVNPYLEQVKNTILISDVPVA